MVQRNTVQCHVSESGYDGSMMTSGPFHPLGHPLSVDDVRCGECCWSVRKGPGPKVLRCLAAGGLIPPRVEAQQHGCDRWEADPDCLECNACCGPAYDVVEVGTRDPVRASHPKWVEKADGRYRIRRTSSGHCAALLEDGRCRIYAGRPRCCRDFEKLSANCIHARRRAGRSQSWSMGG